MALEDANEEIEAARTAIMVSLELVRLLARKVPDRICDPPAERAVIGWMLSGRARPSDFAELRPGYDFTTRPRRWLAGISLELLETADPLIPAERSVVHVALNHVEPDLADEMDTELLRLPFPDVVPTREIDLVTALGRGWSVVDDAYRGAL